MFRLVGLAIAFIVLLAAGIMAGVNIFMQPVDTPQIAQPSQPRRQNPGTDASVSTLQNAPSTAEDLLVNGKPPPAQSSALSGTALAGRVGDYVQSPTMPNGTFVQSPLGNVSVAAPSHARPVTLGNPIGN